MKKVFYNWTTDTNYELVTRKDKGRYVGSVFVNGFGINAYVANTEEEVLKEVEKLYPFLVREREVKKHQGDKCPYCGKKKNLDCLCWT